mgnify:FL=1
MSEEAPDWAERIAETLGSEVMIVAALRSAKANGFREAADYAYKTAETLRSQADHIQSGLEIS